MQGGEPAADGRTDGGDEFAGLRNSLIERVCREWARWGVTEWVARPGVDRLLNTWLTERELECFLVSALEGKHHAFIGVEESLRWGQSTEARRIALWLNSERVRGDMGLAGPRRVLSERDEPKRPTREERERAATQAQALVRQTVRR